MTTGSSASAGPSASAGLIIPSPSAGLLLPVVLDMSKPFHIGKLVTSADNTTAMKTLKGTIWIAGVPFSSLNKAGQYMLDILDPAHQLEVAEDVAHQQVLSAEIIGSKYKIMGRLLKRDWKAVVMAKETMTDQIVRIQPVVTALKKNSGNWSKTLSDIRKYWGQALYNWFDNIEKELRSDKFFCCLGTIIRQYKRLRMLIAF